jgi:hypothetical protein
LGIIEWHGVRVEKAHDAPESEGRVSWVWVEPEALIERPTKAKAAAERCLAPEDIRLVACDFSMDDLVMSIMAMALSQHKPKSLPRHFWFVQNSLKFEHPREKYGCKRESPSSKMCVREKG